MKHEAFLYDKRDDKKVRCKLCSHRCIIRPGARGICRVRENRDGTLYSLNYDKVIATHVDPIEKKPLFHFKPGSRSFSIATVGCNFSCTFCQNHDISQWMNNGNDSPVGDAIAPGRTVQLAKESGSASIAFTYTEPTIFAELAYDVARLAKDEGIASVFVSNGYMTPEMIEYFGPLIAAANIDLKAFKDESYREVIGGRLQPVLDNIRLLKANDT